MINVRAGPCCSACSPGWCCSAGGDGPRCRLDRPETGFLRRLHHLQHRDGRDRAAGPAGRLLGRGGQRPRQRRPDPCRGCAGALARVLTRRVSAPAVHPQVAGRSGPVPTLPPWETTSLLVLVVVTALAFDFTNGFHDTGNAMATSIATGALPPESRSPSPACSTWSARSCRSASRRRSPAGWCRHQLVTLTVVFAGLAGGIIWNLPTWFLGIPSSSSHALIGGVVGSTLAAAGGARGQVARPVPEGDHPGRAVAGHRRR